MRCRSPLSIFTVVLVLVYWCASVVLSPFPYWVGKVMPGPAHTDAVVKMDEECCSCGMGSGCSMPCCAGETEVSGVPSHRGGLTERDGNRGGGLHTGDGFASSGVGCGCLLGVPPTDVPIEYIPVYGKHYYYPLQYIVSLAVIEGWGDVGDGDEFLYSLYEVGPSSPPPRLSI